jgi:putative MATE family efflux protein
MEDVRNVPAKTSALVTRKFRDFFVPTLFASMASQMGVFVDSLIVGNMISSDAMAGVGVCLPLEQILGSCALLFSVGASAMIAAALGSRKNDEANRIYSYVITLDLGAAFFFLVLMLPFVKEIAIFLAGEQKIAGPAYEYLKVMVWRTPFLMLLGSADILVRTDGKAMISSQGIVLSQIANIFLDLLLIGVFKLGITGAAIATVASDVTGILYIVIRYFSAKDRSLHFTPFDEGIKAFFTRVKEILASGMAAAIAYSLVSVKIWCVYRILGSNGGDEAMKTYTVCLDCLVLLSLVVAGCQGAMLPILGVLYGEKDYRGVRMLTKYALKFALGLNSICIILICIFPKIVFRIFNITGELAIKGSFGLRLFSLSMLGVAFSFMMMYYYSAVEQVAAATIISVVEGILVVPMSLLLVKGLADSGVWISFVLSEIATVIVAIIYAKILKKKDPEAFPDIYLIPQTLSELLYDVSVKATRENASLLSKDAMEKLRGNGVSDEIALKAGVALEEMTLNLITAGKKPFQMDVRIIRSGDNISIAMRDNGIPFNPMEYSSEEQEKYITDGILLFKALAKDINYSRILNLNQTIIEI